MAMTSPTLLVLAAGMGIRYGGIKQMDPVGPAGEFILDYSVYDAWRAGFRRVVFIIREELEAPLREHFGHHLDGRMEMDFAVQSLNDLPEGFVPPAGRSKPWGTAHAIWCARKAVKGPFAAINADDFYGQRSFRVLADFFSSEQFSAHSCALVAFQLNRTLSENGTVSRGVCSASPEGLLTGIIERTSIVPDGHDGAKYADEAGNWHPLTGREPASMNLWGFPDTFFPQLERLLIEFLKENGGELKKEFYIPFAVNSLIEQAGWQTYVRSTPEHWFGMTYPQDRQMVLQRISELTAAGVYPKELWQ